MDNTEIQKRERYKEIKKDFFLSTGNSICSAYKQIAAAYIK